VIDLATGLVGRVGPDTKALGYAFSPDGRRVLYTDLRWRTGGDEASAEPRYNMILADRRAGVHPGTVAEGLRDLGLTMSWDPFGRQVAYADSAGEVDVIGTDVIASPPASWRELAQFGRPGVNFRNEYWPPLWSGDGKRVYMVGADTLWEGTVKDGSFRAVGGVSGAQTLGVMGDTEHGKIWTTPDGKGALLLASDTATHLPGFFRISLESGQVTPLWRSPHPLAVEPPYSLRVTDNGTVVLLTKDVSGDPEIWVSSDGLQTAHLVSNLRRPKLRLADPR